MNVFWLCFGTVFNERTLRIGKVFQNGTAIYTFGLHMEAVNWFLTLFSLFKTKS